MQTVTYVRRLADPGEYDRLVELESRSIWCKLGGPFGGLHLLNEVRVPYFERVFGGFKGKSILAATADTSKAGSHERDRPRSVSLDQLP